MLTAGQMIAALGTGIGVITLGPTAFKLGVELGNGLDQLIGFPSWDVYEKEESPKPAGYSLRFCEAPAVLKAENREFPCPDAGGGTFVVYRQGAFAVEDEWVTKPGCEEPIHSFIGSQGIRGNLVSGTSIYGGACEKYNERAWFYELCKGHATEGTGTCMPPEAGGAHVELPETGPLTPEQQTVNKAHGLEARPHVKPPELKREEHLTPKQHAQWWWGEPGKQGHLTPAEFKKLLEEHENGKEPVPFNESELEPGPKFIENNSPEPETETETPTEPAPPETPGLAVPGIHWPNFAALCKNFPFGVPCWLFLELHEWAGAAVVPKWEFHFPLPVIGGTVSMKMSLESLEPAMEILRPIIALVVFVELVLLFYRLAMGGSPNTSSTTDSDEG